MKHFDKLVGVKPKNHQANIKIGFTKCNLENASKCEMRESYKASRQRTFILKNCNLFKSKTWPKCKSLQFPKQPKPFLENNSEYFYLLLCLVTCH